MGKIVAALDLGTSKSIALVAEKEYPGNKLSVIKTETLASNNAIRRGRIYNSEETSDIISKLINKLNYNSKTPIEKIYVGIGGQSLHTQLFKARRVVEDGEAINLQLLESLKKEALDYIPEFEENLGICSCEYYADGHLVSNPRGTMASVIEAQFQLMVGNPCLKRNLENEFSNKKGISVAGYFISPLATAEAVLTLEEKKSGCALVEWGDGVTYLSVYKNKALKYMVAIPLGGLAITKDIRSLNVLEEEAEALKIEYGSAIVGQNNNESVPVNKEQNPSRNVDLHYLNLLIEARVDEIVENIKAHIQMSGYFDKLDAGIVITAGGALLQGLPQFIKNQTGKEVRLAKPKVWINQVETLISPAHSCVVGLAVLGEESCVNEKALYKEKEQQATPLFGEEEFKVEERKNVDKKEDKEKDKKEDKLVEKQPSPFFASTIKKIRGKIKDTIEGGVIIFSDDDTDNNNSKTLNNNTTNKK